MGGLGGRHNVRLGLSGHGHRYRHEVRDGITYITGAGIANGGECDVMILRVHRRYLVLGRYIVEGDGAISRVRELCGNTDPSKAGPGTIRATYGLNLTMNSIHASDSPTTAREEVGFFFPDLV